METIELTCFLIRKEHLECDLKVIPETPAKLAFKKSEVSHFRQVLCDDGSLSKRCLINLKNGDNYEVGISYEALKTKLDW